MAPSSANIDFHRLIGALFDGSLTLDVGFHHIPNGWPFNAFIHRCPAGNHIGFRRIDRFSGLQQCHVGNAASDFLVRCAGVAHAADANHIAALLQERVLVKQVVADIFENFFDLLSREFKAVNRRVVHRRLGIQIVHRDIVAGEQGRAPSEAWAEGKLGIALTSFHLNIAPFYLMIIRVALGGAWDWRAAVGASVVGIGDMAVITYTFDLIAGTSSLDVNGQSVARNLFGSLNTAASLSFLIGKGSAGETLQIDSIDFGGNGGNNVIPLPAGLPLLATALVFFGFVRRKAA